MTIKTWQLSVDRAVHAAIVEYQQQQTVEIARLQDANKQLQTRYAAEIVKRVAQTQQAIAQADDQVNCVADPGSSYHQLLEQARIDHTISISAVQAGDN